ncbi:MAG: hypothetical protein QOG00_134 [Pyrinomonadaceae bacterium]|nr:hypothetical protein [Pyrinomonadaceae bacterium]
MAKRGKATSNKRPRTTSPALLPQPAAKPEPAPGKVWRLTESNLFWGGGVGVILVAYGFLLAGALKFSIALIIFGWLVITYSIYRHNFFEGKPKRIQVVCQVLISLSTVAILTWIWLSLLPTTAREETPLVQSQSTPILSTPSNERPEFTLGLGQIYNAYSESEDKTKLLIEVEIRNTGAPSITTDWRIHYKSPTLDQDLRTVRFKNEAEPVVFPLSDDADTGIAFNSSEAINITTARTPIMRGVPAIGRVLVNVPGNKTSELQTGEAVITVTLHDYLKDRDYSGQFKGRKGLPGEALQLLPTDKLLPRSKQRGVNRSKTTVQPQVRR